MSKTADPFIVDFGLANPTNTPPKFSLDAFCCPYCGTHSHQIWFVALAEARGCGNPTDFHFSRCQRCAEFAVWHINRLIHPRAISADRPHADVPAEIAADFEEARAIAQDSPRGAAALLRLCIQKLCIHLDQPGKNINEDIKVLVGIGLPSKVQKALDTVRVIGNECVHPGSLDIRDDKETVTSLFPPC